MPHDDIEELINGVEKLDRRIKKIVRRAEVRGILRFCHSQRRYVTYVELAKALGMFSGGSELATCLGEIMEEDFAAGRPFVSSLVVSALSRMPAAGYFAHARQIGALDNDREGTGGDRSVSTAEKAFWLTMVEKLGLDVPPLSTDS